MLVDTILTREPLSIAPGASLDEAAESMDTADVRHLVVVEDGRVVGVLSDRDLLGAQGWRRSADRGEPEPGEQPLVRDVMHAPVVSVEPPDSVVMAAVEMSGRGIGCLPVVEGGRLVGIVSELDLLHALRSAARHGALSGDLDPRIEERMRSPVVTVQIDETLADARERCASVGVRHLPVVERGTLRGILSDRDLRRATGERRDPQTCVADLMTERVVTVAPDQRLSDAADRMLRHKVSSVPVVDEGALVGIVTTTDLLDHCMEALRELEDA